MPRKLTKTPIAKSVQIVQEGDRAFKIYTYPWNKKSSRADGSTTYYWATCRKKREIFPDKVRRRGVRKTKTRIWELLQALPEKELVGALDYLQGLYDQAS